MQDAKFKSCTNPDPRVFSVSFRMFSGALALLLVLAVPARLLAAPEVRRVERGSLVLENIPDTPAALRDRLRMYQAVRGALMMDFAPDGRSILMQTRFGETAQLHRVDAPMTMRRQITF